MDHKCHVRQSFGWGLLLSLISICLRCDASQTTAHSCEPCVDSIDTESDSIDTSEVSPTNKYLRNCVEPKLTEFVHLKALLSQSQWFA